MKKLLSMTLQEIYLEYLNSNMDVSKFADIYGVDKGVMFDIVISARVLCKEVYDSKEL